MGEQGGDAPGAVVAREAVVGPELEVERRAVGDGVHGRGDVDHLGRAALGERDDEAVDGRPERAEEPGVALEAGAEVGRGHGPGPGQGELAPGDEEAERAVQLADGLGGVVEVDGAAVAGGADAPADDAFAEACEHRLDPLDPLRVGLGEQLEHVLGVEAAFACEGGGGAVEPECDVHAAVEQLVDDVGEDGVASGGVLDGAPGGHGDGADAEGPGEVRQGREHGPVGVVEGDAEGAVHRLLERVGAEPQEVGGVLGDAGAGAVELEGDAVPAVAVELGLPGEREREALGWDVERVDLSPGAVEGGELGPDGLAGEVADGDGDAGDAVAREQSQRLVGRELDAGHLVDGDVVEERPGVEVLEAEGVRAACAACVALLGLEERDADLDELGALVGREHEADLAPAVFGDDRGGGDLAPGDALEAGGRGRVAELVGHDVEPGAVGHDGAPVTRGEHGAGVLDVLRLDPGGDHVAGAGERREQAVGQ